MAKTPPIALLLEDEPLIAIDLEISLASAGFEVTTAMSCFDAHAWLDDHRPDIVIVDIQLRDGPSDSVATRLVDLRIPFIVHSGDVLSQFDGTPFAHGIWLPKPSSEPELEAAIKSATQHFP